MLYAPETKQLADRYAPGVEDLRTIARLHGLPTGSPECLAALPLRIAQDFRLRSDLTEHVRSLQAHDPELGLPEVLSLFVSALGGPAAAKRDRNLEEPLDLTGSFLASLGGWPGSAVEPLLDLDNPPNHDPRLDLAFAAAGAETRRQKTFVEEVEVAPVATEPDNKDEPTPHELASLAEITHALARLERGNLELRLHLDSIDQRICRMEPLLESVPHLDAGEAPPREPASPVTTVPSREPSAASLPSAIPASAPPRRSSPSEPELTQDALERDRNLRRLALTSAFAEPLPIAVSPVGSPTLPELRRSAAPRPSTPLGGAINDPIPAPRATQLRRDRFAAARELPGNDPDLDPLYNAPDEPAAPLRSPALPRTPLQTRPEPVTPLPETASPVTPPLETASAASSSPFVRAAPATEPEAPAPRISDFPSPVTGTVPSASAPSAEPLRAAEPREPLPREPLLRPTLRSPLFGAAAASASDESELNEQPRKRRSWFSGIALFAVLGAAGVLYVNGLPSAATRWLGGDSSPQTSQRTPSSNNTPRSSDAAATAQPTFAPATPSARPSSTRASDQPRHLREDSGASDSGTEITSAPTFVPGPVMDGHLVAAPRPEYPGIAHLAGVDGQVTLDVMISKTGEVEALKVLGGPHLLRDAAAAAVRQWQYRPYLVKGKPVEVRTIVRLDMGTPSHPSASE